METFPSQFLKRYPPEIHTAVSWVFTTYSFIFVLSVFAIAIKGLIWPITEQQLWPNPYFSVSDQYQDKLFGIDKVSGYYGPGGWAAWLLLVTSCCIDRGLGTEKSSDAKKAHLLGLDLNIVVAYLYPIATGVSFIQDIQLYLGDDMTEDTMGTLAAQLVTMRTGASLGQGIALICLSGWMIGRTNGLTAIFSVVCSLFLPLLLRIFEIAYTGSKWPAVIRTFLLVPGSGVKGSSIRQPLGDIAKSFSRRYYRIIHLDFLEHLYSGDVIWIRAMYSNIFFGLFVLATGYWTIRRLDPNSKIPTYADVIFALIFTIFLGTVGWWIAQLYFEFMSTIVLLLTSTESTAPITPYKITDLDQMFALLASGIFVLIVSFGDLISREHEMFSSMYRVTVQWFKRQLGRRNTVDIATNF